VRPSSFVTRQSFLKAVAVNAAIGGSTNAIVHLLAVANMAGIPFTLEDWEKGAQVPLLTNVKPSGQFLMEEYYRAGGLPAVLRELARGGYIDDKAGWCSGKTMREELAAHDDWVDRNVIYSHDAPLRPDGGTVVLKGNLCPDGAVIKVSAVANQALLQHRGQAVVFDSIEEYHKGIDDPALGITAENVLVLRNCGPLGYPGMPEVGNVRPPGYLLAKGVKAMVTLSDARMSGTAYGCHVLHIAPEAATGGPLAIVRSGDWVELDVKGRKVTLDISDEEFKARMAQVAKKPAAVHSPWGAVWQDERLGVHQANVGAYMKIFDQPGLSGSEIAKQVRARLRPQH
jgi:dihydroxy-acid dehydratase